MVDEVDVVDKIFTDLVFFVKIFGGLRETSVKRSRIIVISSGYTFYVKSLDLEVNQSL